jgi:ureidoacrylate peracid hydrolase
VKRLPALWADKTALLVIDMQNDFCRPGGFFDKKRENLQEISDIIPRIGDLLEVVRKTNMLRLFIKTVHADYTTSDVWASRLKDEEFPELCLPNTWGSEIVTELKPKENEPVIIKHRHDAFIDTDLPLVLRSRKIRNLIITGCTTNVCVESTARHAFMFDYLTVTVRDCVATKDEGAHEPSLRNLENYFGYVATSDQVKKNLSP